ncbi:MAG: hypothetical protein ACLFPQ_00400 [Candidatus Woesearchaeota archaeon]
MGGKAASDQDFLIEGFLSLLEKYPVKEQRNIIKSLSRKFDEKLLTPDKLFLPASIFSFKLGAFESICRYLKDELGFSSKDISILTNRTQSTIDNTYRKSLEKFEGNLDISEKTYLIPLFAIADKNIGIQESIVGYLHENYKLQFNQISDLLERNYQTIRTAYLKYVEKKA